MNKPIQGVDYPKNYYAMPGIPLIVKEEYMIGKDNIHDNRWYAIEQVFGITKEQIRSKTRKAEIVKARHVIRYLYKRETKLPLREISVKTSPRLDPADHSTIINSINKVNKMKFSDPKFAEKLRKLESR